MDGWVENEGIMGIRLVNFIYLFIYLKKNRWMVTEFVWSQLKLGPTIISFSPYLGEGCCPGLSEIVIGLR